MRDPYPWFTGPCVKAFGRLSSEFGFSFPSIEQIGQERYLRSRSTSFSLARRLCDATVGPVRMGMGVGSSWEG
jgi:hypothetical protein